MSTRTLLTLKQFEQLPDEPGKRELLKGELLELPPASNDHNKVAHIIFRQLDPAIEKAKLRGEASLLGETRFEVSYLMGGGSWLQPDLSVTHPGQRTSGIYLAGSPAIAIEVVSPSNTPRALAIKTAVYFEHGALEVWHFHPKKGHVVRHVAGVADPIIIRDFVRTPLLPGFALDVQQTLKP